MYSRARLKSLALAALLVPLSAAHDSNGQLALVPSAAVASAHETPVTVRRTLVDLLSADPDHSLLIRLLQRSRLITTLNRLNGSTFFAPTNDAIQAAASTAESVWARALSEDGQPVDNIQSQLRATLLYHLINYTLPYNTSDAPSEVQTLETLLFPHPEEGHGPPGDPPDGEGDTRKGSLLAGEGQKLRIVRDQKTFIGTDAKGKGGIEVAKPDRNATNGNLVSLAGVLTPPKSIAEIIQSHPALSELARLLPRQTLDDLASRPHVTLFAPNDSAWHSLSPLEWRYLKSGFAQDDLLEILGHHTRSKPKKRGSVGYVSRLVDDSGTIETDGGHQLVVEASSHGAVRVNRSRIIQGDLFASNGALNRLFYERSLSEREGVVHIIESLLLPPKTFALTLEKTLIALNATLFVAAMRDANLSHHLQYPPNDAPEQTILAFQDGAVELGWMVLPEPGNPALISTLQYHLVEGSWRPSDLNDSQLLDTALRPALLKGAPQKLQVSRPDGFDRQDRDDIVFGNANVVSGPYDVGKSILYVVGQVIEPPPQVLEVAMTNLHLSTFAASVYAADSAHALRTSPATTVLAPTNEAFETLGLVLSYLLLPTAKSELRQLLSYHALQGLVYLDGNATSVDDYLTLEHSPITIERFNGSTEVYGPTVAGFPANGDLRNASVMPSTETMLTSTGVLHVLDQVELPPDLDITLVKLLRGAKGTTMIELLKLANMTWVLDGEREPDGAWVAGRKGRKRAKRRQRALQKKLFDRDSYTILCPSDKAFSRLNLTYYRSNLDELRELLELHVIRSSPPGKNAINNPSRFPSAGRPLALSDEAVYPTLLSKSSDFGDLAFRSFGRDNYVVGIKGAKGSNGGSDWASVVAFGRATPQFVTDEDPVGDTVAQIMAPKMVFGGGVLAIDAVLTPYEPNWYYRWGWIVVVVVLSIFAAVAIGLLIYKLFVEHEAHKAYDRLEGEED